MEEGAVSRLELKRKPHCGAERDHAREECSWLEKLAKATSSASIGTTRVEIVSVTYSRWQFWLMMVMTMSFAGIVAYFATQNSIARVVTWLVMAVPIFLYAWKRRSFFQ